MRRESSFWTRPPMGARFTTGARWRATGVAMLALTGVGCGGSASETPFPQPPIDDRLAARHERANAPEEATEASTTNVATQASAAATASSSNDSAPLPDPGVSPAPGPAF